MRPEYAGWFCEVPRSVKEEFKKLYPGRSAQRKVTLAAIEWAIATHPSNNKGKDEEASEREHSSASADSQEVETNGAGAR